MQHHIFSYLSVLQVLPSNQLPKSPRNQTLSLPARIFQSPLVSRKYTRPKNRSAPKSRRWQKSSLLTWGMTKRPSLFTLSLKISPVLVKKRVFLVSTGSSANCRSKQIFDLRVNNLKETFLRLAALKKITNDCIEFCPFSGRYLIIRSSYLFWKLYWENYGRRMFRGNQCKDIHRKFCTLACYRHCIQDHHVDRLKSSI